CGADAHAALASGNGPRSCGVGVLNGMTAAAPPLSPPPLRDALPSCSPPKLPNRPPTTARGTRNCITDTPRLPRPAFSPSAVPCRDRKSTRLNSSHVNSSYAVVCLKKRTNGADAGESRPHGEDDPGGR